MIYYFLFAVIIIRISITSITYDSPPSAKRDIVKMVLGPYKQEPSNSRIPYAILSQTTANYVDGRARRESRPTNGTLTLRRSSTTPFAQSSSQAEPPLPTPTAEAPGHNYYNDSSEYRISKEQLLDIYKAQEDSGARNGDVSHLFESGWNPGQSNGGSRASWGKSSDNRDNHAADICWDTSGNIQPIGLEDMTEQEKTVCHLAKY